MPKLPKHDRIRIVDNTVHDMQDAGMAILESFDADIHDNTFTNVKYGIRISLGGGNNNVYDNVFDQCSACEYRIHVELWKHNYPHQLTPDGQLGI